MLDTIPIPFPPTARTEQRIQYNHKQGILCMHPYLQQIHTLEFKTMFEHEFSTHTQKPKPSSLFQTASIYNSPRHKSPSPLPHAPSTHSGTTKYQCITSTDLYPLSSKCMNPSQLNPLILNEHNMQLQSHHPQPVTFSENYP